jgi:GntR family transcriptional repressor for pyruvate dehydrogenase complex
MEKSILEELERAPRQRLSHTVAELLLERIRDESLAPGTRLPSERELMRRLHVGRSTVREALNGLALTGVLEIRHGQGVFVASPAVPAPESLDIALRRGVTRELTQARLVVEPALAALAALHATREDLVDIERRLVVYEKSLDGPNRVREGVRFHQRLFGGAHNDVLLGFVRRYSPMLMERGEELEIGAPFEDAQYETHRRLFEAVALRDARLARERMVGHLVHDAHDLMEGLRP